jgi:hypothetical protein
MGLHRLPSLSTYLDFDGHPTGTLSSLGSISPRSPRRGSSSRRIRRRPSYLSMGMGGYNSSSYNSNNDSDFSDVGDSKPSPRPVNMLSRQDSMDFLLGNFSGGSPASLAVGVQETWSCTNCTLDNELDDSKCAICQNPRPFIPSSGRKQPGQEAPFKIMAKLTAVGSDSGGPIFVKDTVGGAFASGSGNGRGSSSAAASVNSRKRKASAGKKKMGQPRPELKKRKRSRLRLVQVSKEGLVRVDGKIPQKKGMKFVCGYCDKEFKYMTNWRSHERVHTGEKIFVCKWEGCNKKFAHLSSLQAHIAKHQGIKPFACEQPGCTQKFANKSNLNRHMRKIHKMDTLGNPVVAGKVVPRRSKKKKKDPKKKDLKKKKKKKKT